MIKMENNSSWHILKIRNRFINLVKVHIAKEGIRQTVCGKSLSSISTKTLIEERTAPSLVSALNTRDDMADKERQICVKCGMLVTEMLGRSISRTVFGEEILRNSSVAVRGAKDS